jgi:hypothetical protein
MKLMNEIESEYRRGGEITLGGKRATGGVWSDAVCRRAGLTKEVSGQLKGDLQHEPA